MPAFVASVSAVSMPALPFGCSVAFVASVSAHVPGSGPEDPVDEAGSLGSAEFLCGLDRFADCDFEGYIVPEVHLVEGDPHDVLLERRDPAQVPTLGVFGDGFIGSLLMSFHALGQLDREGFSPGEKGRKGPIGRFLLVTGKTASRR